MIVVRTVHACQVETYDDWHNAMSPLLPFTHFVRLDGSHRTFLDDFCRVFCFPLHFSCKQGLDEEHICKARLHY